ncbi:Gfo/Idh/MocA family protein [Actinokineospora sp. 24-640]
MVRVGVVGCGMIAQLTHLPYLKELPELFSVAAVCDLDIDLARAVAERFAVPAAHGSVGAMLDAERLDAVLVLTQDHYEPAVAALARGLHTFTEKPLCHTLAEGRSLVAMAESAGVVLMVGLMKRYDSGVRMALREIAGLRAPVLARAHVVVGPDYGNWIIPELRPDIVRPAARSTDDPRRPRIAAEFGPAPAHLLEAYMDMFGVWSHDINLLRAAFPAPPSEVHAIASADGATFTAMLLYPGGTQCVFQGSKIDLPLFDEGLAVWSAEKVVELSVTNPFQRDFPAVLRTSTVDEDGRGLVQRAVVGSHSEAFRNQLIHFHDCVTTGRQPLTSGKEALADIELMLRMLHAARR